MSRLSDIKRNQEPGVTSFAVTAGILDIIGIGVTNETFSISHRRSNVSWKPLLTHKLGLYQPLR